MHEKREYRITMGKKKKRQQPVPKKHKRLSADAEKQKAIKKQFKKLKNDMMGKVQFVREHRDKIEHTISQKIESAIVLFNQYDKVLLLGGLGLRLIDSVDTLEKTFESAYYQKPKHLDEDIETIVEYALSFATALPNNSKTKPTSQVIEHLYQELLELKKGYAFLEIVDSVPTDGGISEIRMLDRINFMNVRGDGYMQHLAEVYGELFALHDDFLKTRYGCDSKFILNFIQTIEQKVLSKIGNGTGTSLAHQRWKDWSDKHSLEEMYNLMQGGDSVPIMAGFLHENPDLAGDGSSFDQIVVYRNDDFENSYNIFWTVPDDEAEETLMDKLSMQFGDNGCFVRNNEYRGHIANKTNINDKPFIKYEDRYFLFSAMICHRNMYCIAENLIKVDNDYYQSHFLGNNYAECRDNYMERKVADLLQRIMPEASFYPSAKYKVMDEGVEREAELDLLVVYDDVILLVEAKSHKLTDADKRAGAKGLMDKLNDSIGYAAYQAHRAKRYIEVNNTPEFTSNGNRIKINKTNTKHIFKIATTFDHMSSMVCDMNNLVKEGVMKPDYKDTWVVSLFDLMVVSDKCKGKEEFEKYLLLHEQLPDVEIHYFDELDVFGAFCEGQLDRIIKRKGAYIYGFTKRLDDEYYNDALGVLPIRK